MSHGMLPVAKDPALRARIAHCYSQGIGINELKRRFSISTPTLYGIVEEFKLPSRGKPKNGEYLPDAECSAILTRRLAALCRRLTTEPDTHQLSHIMQAIDATRKDLGAITGECE